VIQDWLDQTRFQVSPSAKRSALDTGGRRLLTFVSPAGLRALCGLGMIIALSGCSGGLFGHHAPPPVVEKSDTKVPDDYVIGSGDSLSIFVYRNPDLSEGGVAVRPDGRISTPLIEDIVAIGPPDRQVRVIGEATDPIAIPYRDHMTLLDVMIATHGMTKYAAGNRAVVVRIDPDGKQQSIKVRLTDLIKYGEIEQNIEMSPGDTLIIPQSWF
jgi:polysaccharide export outer membrane protein